MSFFFNGRLWTSPATMSATNDSAMANQNLSVGNVLCLIGESTGGAPNTPLSFGSPAEAQAALMGGELMTAAMKAFNPSDETGGPATVICIRVNPAVQSTLALKDASANSVIDLTSQDYGQYTNGIKAKIAAGSLSGLQATVQLGTSYYVGDNLGRNAFTLQYTGAAATATMAITNSAITLSAPTGTVVGTVDLTTYQTVQQVVDYINTIPGFSATVSGASGTTLALNGLDSVTSQDVKTALYTVTANLQAVVDWFNSQAQPYVTATRPAGAGAPPAIVGFTYLSGGSDGVTTNTNWGNAFTALQSVDVQWITPISSDQSIVAMCDAHCQYMSTVGRMERRSICGTALGTTDAIAISDALAINSDRTSLVHLGYYDYDPVTGAWTLYSPYMLAAMIAAAFSGLNPGTPLTNKTLTVRGLERILLDPTDTDPLIQGGILCVTQYPSGFKVVQSISTWLANSNYDKVEQSVGWAVDFTMRNVRNALDPLRGSKASPILLNQAVSKTETQLRQLAVPEPQGPGVLVGDAKNPPYKNITATLSGDVVQVAFQCSPVIPDNYIAVTAALVPYSGTATA